MGDDTKELVCGIIWLGIATVVGTAIGVGGFLLLKHFIDSLLTNAL